MRAKIINNEIHYSSNFMKLGENWVSYPTDEQLEEGGWKDFERIITEDLTKLDFEETSDKIIEYIKI